MQDVLETIFRARALDFRREQDSVPYSTKRYIPDFTFNRIGLAVEVKLCKGQHREKEMIEEINSDIIGYGGRYDRCLFVIYDLGHIRDVAQFSRDIEQNPNVHVLIIKKEPSQCAALRPAIAAAMWKPSGRVLKPLAQAVWWLGREASAAPRLRAHRRQSAGGRLAGLRTSPM